MIITPGALVRRIERLEKDAREWRIFVDSLRKRYKELLRRVEKLERKNGKPNAKEDEKTVATTS